MYRDRHAIEDCVAGQRVEGLVVDERVDVLARVSARHPTGVLVVTPAVGQTHDTRRDLIADLDLDLERRDSLAEHSAFAGLQAVLYKPFRLDQLIDTVQQVVKSQESAVRQA